MRTLALSIALAVMTVGCGETTTKTDNATNNGATNNSATNNSATNNGATNNGATNNGATNNGATNNGATNNGTGGVDLAAWIRAYCEYDATCTAPDYSTVEDCVADNPIQEEACWKYDLQQYEQCLDDLASSCGENGDASPDSCEAVVDVSDCCAQNGEVFAEGECRTPCESADDCGSQFQCREGACICDDTLVNLNDQLVCLYACEDSTDCLAEETCMSGVCIPGF